MKNKIKFSYKPPEEDILKANKRIIKEMITSICISFIIVISISIIYFTVYSHYKFYIAILEIILISILIIGSSIIIYIFYDNIGTRFITKLYQNSKIFSIYYYMTYDFIDVFYFVPYSYRNKKKRIVLNIPFEDIKEIYKYRGNDKNEIINNSIVYFPHMNKKDLIYIGFKKPIDIISVNYLLFFRRMKKRKTDKLIIPIQNANSFIRNFHLIMQNSLNDCNE
jgi:hypothetical protein